MSAVSREQKLLHSSTPSFWFCVNERLTRGGLKVRDLRATAQVNREKQVSVVGQVLLCHHLAIFAQVRAD